AQSGE
ncbi:hypothetical protein D043_0693B, partial [Vibrio parahaemolyticus EKP-021]